MRSTAHAYRHSTSSSKPLTIGTSALGNLHEKCAPSDRGWLGGRVAERVEGGEDAVVGPWASVAVDGAEFVRFGREASGVDAAQDEARPRNTAIDRPSRVVSSSERRPTRSPSFERGTVVILSTISRLGSRIPVVSFASTGIRNNGASVWSVVNAHTVTDAVASKRSSWMMTTGGGLPTQPVPAAAVQISPRFTRRR